MDDHLVAVARRILSGGEVPEVDFHRDFKPFDGQRAARLANELWLVCRMFQDDGDIRTREAEYDQQQREAVSWRLNAYLQALENDR